MTDLSLKFADNNISHDLHVAVVGCKSDPGRGKGEALAANLGLNQ